MECFPFIVLCFTARRAQLWFWPHLFMWATLRCLLAALARGVKEVADWGTLIHSGWGGIRCVVWNAYSIRDIQEVTTEWACSVLSQVRWPQIAEALAGVGHVGFWEVRGRDVKLLIGHLGAAVAVVVVQSCFWSLNQQLCLTPISGARIGSTLLSMDAGRKKLLWRAHRSTLTSLNNDPLSLWQTQAFSQTSLVVVNYTLAPSGCLHAANTSPFPGVWLLKPKYQCPDTIHLSEQVDKHFSRESAGKPDPSGHGFLHFALCTLVAVLFSEAPKSPPHPAFPAIPASEGTSQCTKTFFFFFFSWLPTRSAGLILIPLFLSPPFSFVLLSYTVICCGRGFSFGSLKFSASIQWQKFCESNFTCRCIFHTSVGRR